MNQERIIELLQKYGYQHLVDRVPNMYLYILIDELKYATISYCIEKGNKPLLFHALGIEMTDRKVYPANQSGKMFYNYDHLCLCTELGYKLSVFKRHPCALMIMQKDIHIPTLEELHGEIVYNESISKAWDYLFKSESIYHIEKSNVSYIISQLINRRLLLDNVKLGTITIPKIKHYPHPLTLIFKAKQASVTRLLGLRDINGNRRKTLKDLRSTGIFKAQLKIRTLELNNQRLNRLIGKKNTLILSWIIPTDLCRYISSYI